MSVDLDDLGCYYAVHGVQGVAPRLALTRWLPRFIALFESLRIRATFFVIGRDLEADLEGAGEGAVHLRAALEAGHELASHSYAHPYDMTRWSAAAIGDDLARADALLRSVGARPCGFRAPGYTHDVVLLKEVADLGYRYDSSVLPSPPYYVGKLGVMAMMAMRGRRSSSSVRGARSFLGPVQPFRRVDVPLVELPMSVTPRLRMPIIGTTVLGGPEWLRRHLVRHATSMPHLHLELHAIDLGGGDGDGIEVALPELRTPLATREARLRELLRARGSTTTLAELASWITPISSR